MAESKKMGRPKAEDPKCRNIQVRFTESEYAKIGKYWSREEIDAIGTAAKLDDIAYQINQHNEN